MNWDLLQQHNYSPYSGQLEACLVIGAHGVYPGVRVENIAYPQTITALQGAIGMCLGCGDQPLEIWQPERNEKTPSADELFWKKWIEKLSNGNHLIKWVYSDNIPKELGDAFTEMRNPLRVVQQNGGSEMTSLFIDAVQPEVDWDRRKFLGDVAKLAYIPQSNFPVSALLETDKGLIGGVNVEFDLWNFGLCAERNAIHTAIAYGARPSGSIAIFAPKSQLCSPCGMCRQTLGEWPFLERALLYHGDGSCSEHRIEDLLPLHFQATTLRSE